MINRNITKWGEVEARPKNEHTLQHRVHVRGIHKGSDGSILKEARWTWRLEGSESLQARSQRLQRRPPPPPHEVLLHDDDARFIQTISYNEARQFPPRLRVLSTRSFYHPPLRQGEEQASGYQPFFFFFLFFFLFSRYNVVAVRRGRPGKRQRAHRVCKYIHVFTNTHTQGVESLWGEGLNRVGEGE